MPWEGWYSLSHKGRGLGRGAWSRILGWVELSFPWAASSAGERLPHTQEVVGSNPTPPTTSSVAPSSSGLGRSPLKAETAGSNPAGATPLAAPWASSVPKLGIRTRLNASFLHNR